MSNILTSNSPAPGSIAWREFTHTFGETKTVFPAGSTNKKLVYRRGSSTTLTAADALPGDWKDDDVLFFANRDGFAINATSATGLFGDLIVPGTIISQNLATGAVKASHIDADAVTADAIGAGQIYGEHISAGAISTSKLSVGTVSDNLVANGSFEDIVDGQIEGWTATATSNGTITPVSGTGVTASGAVAIRLQATSTAANLRMRQTPDKFIPVTNISNKRWYFSVRAGAAATTTSGFYFRVLWMDANKVQLTTGTTQNDIAGNVGLSTTYTVREGQLTPPAGARYACVEIIVTNLNVATSIFIDEVNSQEVTVGAQIQDSGITTAKLATGAVVADKVAAGAITTAKLSVGDFTNLLDNPDFLHGKTSWSGSGVVEVRAGEPNVLKVTTAASGNNDQGNAYTLMFPAEGEEFYGEIEVFGAATNVGGGGPNIHMTVRRNDGTNTWPSFQSTTRAAVQGQWTKLSGIITIPANVEWAKFEPAVSYAADAVGNVYYFRNPRLRRMAAGQLIVDGAILARHITASESMWAKVLGAHKITANEIDTVSLTASTAFITDLEAKIITATAFQGKTFTGGTFTGALLQTDTDPKLGVKVGAEGIQAFDSRPAFVSETGQITSNPNYQARTFYVDPSSGNVYITGTMTATSKVKTTDGATTTDKGDVTVTVGPDAIRGGPMGSFTVLGMPGIRWSNISSTMLAAAGIGGDGEGNLVLASGGAVNDARKSLRLTPWGAEMYGSIDLMEGNNLYLNDGHLWMMGSGNAIIDGGKLLFNRDHTGALGSNWIQSNFPVRFSGLNTSALQTVYAANYESSGHVHVLTGSGMARLVGNNSGGNNWISLLRDDQTGGLAGLRRWSGNNGTGFNAMPVYDLTTASAANVNISSGGWLQRSTSARKYKQDIQPVDPAVYEDNLLALQPRSWIDKGEAAAVAEYNRRIAEGEPVVDPDTGEPLTAAPYELQRYYGYIAEEVLAAGKLGWAVTRHDVTGEVEGLAYDRLAAAVIPIVSKYRTRLRNLETAANQRVSALETRVTNLENRLKAAGIP
jgi:hypothetical protein